MTHMLFVCSKKTAIDRAFRQLLLDCVTYYVYFLLQIHCLLKLSHVVTQFPDCEVAHAYQPLFIISVITYVRDDYN